MMTMNKAKSVALETIARRIERPVKDLLVVDELTQCRRIGWIFFYESRAYLETGDVARALGGTGPVVVTHDGQVHLLDGSRPSAEVLHEFEAAVRRRRLLH
jgi:hypothetical protein